MSDAGALLPELYRIDGIGAWNRGMRTISHQLLGEVPLPPGPLLELGCGGGVFADELATEYAPAPVVAVDLRLHALAYAQHRAAHLCFAQGDLHALSFPDCTFGLVTALDVTDQREVDPAAAYAEIHRILVPGGWLFVRVSAHPFLHGPHDRAFNTGCRYTRHDLLALLTRAGFVAQRVTYVNALLAGPIATVRLLQRWQVMRFSPGLYQDSLANTLLQRALGIEAHWLRRWNLPLGISLCVLAQKIAPESARIG